MSQTNPGIKHTSTELGVVTSGVIQDSPLTSNSHLREHTSTAVATH